MVALPEEAGLLLAVEMVVLLIVRVLLAEFALGTVVVALPAVGASVVEAAPETAVGPFVGAVPVLDFEIVAAVVSVVAPVFVALPVSVCFLPEFWQRLLPWQQVCPRQAT